MKIKTVEDVLPKFIKKPLVDDKGKSYKYTQVEDFIRAKVEFAFLIYKEFNKFVGSLNVEEVADVRQITSKYISMWLSDMLGILYSRGQTLEDLNKNLYNVLHALKYIGTEESLILMFKIFLNTDVEVTAPEAGLVQIKLLGQVRTTIYKYIVPSRIGGYPYALGGQILDHPEECVQPKLKVRKKITKIVFNQKQPDGTIVKKNFAMVVFPEGYEHAFYSFLKKFMPIGRTLKIQSEDGTSVKEFHL